MSNPAAPYDRSAVIYKKSFQSEKICLKVLALKVIEAEKTYGEIRTVTLVSACVPTVR